MKTSTRSWVKNGDSIVGIKVEKFNNGLPDGSFVIPILDVRRTEPERMLANQLIKNQNYQSGSKYMRPSYSLTGRCYQNSHKD